jgi:hypothetical protein
LENPSRSNFSRKISGDLECDTGWPINPNRNRVE